VRRCWFCCLGVVTVGGVLCPGRLASISLPSPLSILTSYPHPPPPPLPPFGPPNPSLLLHLPSYFSVSHLPSHCPDDSLFFCPLPPSLFVSPTTLLLPLCSLPSPPLTSLISFASPSSFLFSSPPPLFFFWGVFFCFPLFVFPFPLVYFIVFLRFGPSTALASLSRL